MENSKIFSRDLLSVETGDSELEDLKRLLESLRFLERYLLFISIREVSLYYFGWAIAVIIGGTASGLIWEAFQGGTITTASITILWVCLAFIVGFLSRRAFKHQKIYILSRLPREKRDQYSLRFKKISRKIGLAWASLSIALYLIGIPLLSRMIPIERATSFVILAFVALGNIATYYYNRKEKIPLLVGIALLAGSPAIFVLSLGYVYLYMTLLIFVVYMLAGIAYLNKADKVLGF